MTDDIGSAFLTDIWREFANQRQLAEKAVAQLSDEDIFRTLDGDANSIGVIMKHVGGNLRSRWSDFLTTDGEKPDRNRDGEFEADTDTRESVEKVWQAGWQTLEATVTALRPEDLLATITIRGEAMPALRAFNRSIAHTSQHVGQIILLAKHFRGAEWQTLSMPKRKR